MNAIKVKICSACKTAFDCGSSSDNSKCWCMDFPSIIDLEVAKDCFCSNCLKQKLSDQIKNEPITIAAKNKNKNTN